MDQQAFQDKIQEDAWQCWGCGRANEHGLQIKSYWSGDEAICTWKPEDYHIAVPGVLNGGIIATLIDCHCTLTAIAACYRAEGREMGTEPRIQCPTVALQVTYLRPTPLNQPVTLRARVKEMKERKTIVVCSLFSEGKECARGEVVTVRMPATWKWSQPE